MNPDNARIPRITAAAGTELADPFSFDTCIKVRKLLIILEEKQFTIHKTFFLHAAWLVQASAH